MSWSILYSIDEYESKILDEFDKLNLEQVIGFPATHSSTLDIVLRTQPEAIVSLDVEYFICQLHPYSDHYRMKNCLNGLTKAALSSSRRKISNAMADKEKLSLNIEIFHFRQNSGQMSTPCSSN